MQDERDIGRTPRRPRPVPRALAAGVLLGVGVTIGWFGAKRLEAADPSSLTGGIAATTTQLRNLEATVLATGIIRPKVGAQVAVGSRVSGVLRRLHVTAGDRVRKGQLLAELDRVEFETQVARAQAAHATATADRVWAEEVFERTRELARLEAATDAELADARRSFETARSREAEAEALLDAAKVQLDYTTIRAPIDGVVGDISTQEGETVAASFAAPTFLTIVDLDRLEVWAWVDETDIGNVEPGQTAAFTVDAYPDTEFSGRVTAIRPTAEVTDNVVNYIALIEIEGVPDRILRPEMTAMVNIQLEGRYDALAVPNGALRRDTDGSYVLVPSTRGLERRTVRTGFRGSAFTEIIDGLIAGQAVALGPAQACTDASSGESDR